MCFMSTDFLISLILLKYNKRLVIMFKLESVLPVNNVREGATYVAWRYI